MSIVRHSAGGVLESLTEKFPAFPTRKTGRSFFWKNSPFPCFTRSCKFHEVPFVGQSTYYTHVCAPETFLLSAIHLYSWGKTAFEKSASKSQFSPIHIIIERYETKIHYCGRKDTSHTTRCTSSIPALACSFSPKPLIISSMPPPAKSLISCKKKKKIIKIAASLERPCVSREASCTVPAPSPICRACGRARAMSLPPRVCRGPRCHRACVYITARAACARPRAFSRGAPLRDRCSRGPRWGLIFGARARMVGEIFFGVSRCSWR